MTDAPSYTHPLEKAWHHVNLAAVIGDPIAQSLSPAIHDYWCHRAGVEGVYLPLSVPDTQADFDRAIDGLRLAGFAGVNVTMPHKTRAFVAATHRDATSELIKASNTLSFTEDTIEAKNTDGYGFAAALQAQTATQNELTSPITTALVLGAGAAASAVCVGLLDAGIKHITIANRTLAKAQALVAMLSSHAPDAVFNIAPWAEAPASDANLIVNATSLGMRHKQPLAFSFQGVTSKPIIADIVYDPLQTPFLRSADAQGFHTFNGLHMLMHQAVPGHERWFGVKPHVDDDLYTHLLATLAGTTNMAPLVIGLTGSIGMGKSTVAQMAADAGVPVWDADAAVHRLYAKNGRGAFALGTVFPDAVGKDGVDRSALGNLVLGNAEAMRQLEAIVHPLVAVDRMLFIREARRRGAARCLLDIPLLFEGDYARYCHRTIVVSADPAVQKARVLARPGMTPEKLASILGKQMPDAEKRARADHVIPTDTTLDETRAALKTVLAQIDGEREQPAT
ncbi:MAG: shikimate dehydrogenase [Pseudomonadota bacterium]